VIALFPRIGHSITLINGDRHLHVVLKKSEDILYTAIQDDDYGLAQARPHTVYVGGTIYPYLSTVVALQLKFSFRRVGKNNLSLGTIYGAAYITAYHESPQEKCVSLT
jgi:hypothetical protein